MFAADFIHQVIIGAAAHSHCHLYFLRCQLAASAADDGVGGQDVVERRGAEMAGGQMEDAEVFGVAVGGGQ